MEQTNQKHGVLGRIQRIFLLIVGIIKSLSGLCLSRTTNEHFNCSQEPPTVKACSRARTEQHCIVATEELLVCLFFIK